MVFCVLSQFITAQTDSTRADTSSYNPKDDFSISGFPVIFYLPETSLSLGAAGIVVFNAGKEKAWRKSQITLGAAYTLKNQVLFFLPYELNLKQKWKLNGELGYYRYFYNYYGIGIDSKKEDLETYDANYPRVLATLSYRLKPQILAGIQYRFDYFKIPRIDSLLAADNPKGAQGGGTVSSVGFTTTYDSRDDIFYPQNGIFATLTAETSGNYTGSSFNYSLIQFDFSAYKTIKSKHTLAANVFTGSTLGDSPFFTYFYFSSGKKGRGFNDRRFIDKNMGVVQLEYRFPIYKRFRGTAFTSLGSVGKTYGEVFTNRQLWSYGGGLRFQLSKKQKTNLRVDVAHGFEGIQFYITLGEAF